MLLIDSKIFTYFLFNTNHQIVCCFAPTIKTHSVPLAESSPVGDREAKNLMFVPFRTIPLHAYGSESRYGFGSRQTNSPINPSIGKKAKSPYIIFGV